MKIRMNDIIDPLENYYGLRKLKENVDLTNSISKEGLYNPIHIIKEGDKYRIIAGHLRYLSAKKLGWNEIECVVVNPT